MLLTPEDSNNNSWGLKFEVKKDDSEKQLHQTQLY